MLDIAQRYQPIVRLIKKNPPPNRKVLEVGGGGDGLGYYLKNYQIIDCDLKHAESIPPNTKPVVIKKEKLPFSNQLFHTTVCVDTLEHLPSPKAKLTLIREMIRVTKKNLYLAVPTGEKSLQIHRRLKRHLDRFYPRKKNQYLEEHLQFGHPSKEEIINSLQKTAPKAKITTLANANLHLWYLFQITYLALPRLYHLLKYRRFWQKILTPFWWLTNREPTLRTIFIVNLSPADEEY